MEAVQKSKTIGKVLLAVAAIAAVGLLWNYYGQKKTVSAPAKKDDAPEGSIVAEKKEPSPASIVPVQMQVDKLSTEDMKAVTNYDASPRATLPTPGRLLIGSDWPLQSNTDLQGMAKQ